jgi:hypothetical protein
MPRIRLPKIEFVRLWNFGFERPESANVQYRIVVRMEKVQYYRCRRPTHAVQQCEHFDPQPFNRGRKRAFCDCANELGGICPTARLRPRRFPSAHHKKLILCYKASPFYGWHNRQNRFFLVLEAFSPICDVANRKSQLKPCFHSFSLNGGSVGSEPSINTNFVDCCDRADSRRGLRCPCAAFLQSTPK